MKFPQVQINDKTILILGAITLYGFSLIAFLIIFLFSESTFYDLVFRGQSIFTQLLHGSIYGFLAYIAILPFIKTDFLGDLSESVELFASRMTIEQIIFISFAAGVGEELLFRVALQHFWGIWFVAFLFVLIHGYLSLKDFKVFLYGLMMVFISAGFGYMANQYGILSSITAHFWIDFLILFFIKKGIDSKQKN